jgi:membrane associated rhomboid family serine protease
MKLTDRPIPTSKQVKIILWLFVILTAIELINLFSGRMLNQLGNIPRYIPGLKGIFLGPFIHGSLQHYFSNIIPVCIFTYLLLQYGFKRYVTVSLWIIICTGMLVWLFGRASSHIGASGVIYGYFGYLLLAGFLSGKLKLMLISVLVAFFYGGLIWGVLPTSPFVSWESHLFGFLSGLVAAKLWATKAK